MDEAPARPAAASKPGVSEREGAAQEGAAQEGAAPEEVEPEEVEPAAAAPALRPHVLLVEDDPQLSSMLAEILDEEGYAVTVARDGQAGLHQGLVKEWDVMIVDRGLPGVEGVDLVTRLRSRGVGAAVLLLTARGTVADRVEGLDAGAQDYLVKPFDVEELLARVRALLRPRTALADELPVGQQRLVLGENRVVGAGADVLLSPTEALLLETLARRPTRVFTREDLLASVFDHADTAGIVDTYVHYLRRKLGREVVETVHGLGYRLGHG
jgi:two-component system response regulator QseB